MCWADLLAWSQSDGSTTHVPSLGVVLRFPQLRCQTVLSVNSVSFVQPSSLLWDSRVRHILQIDSFWYHIQNMFVLSLFWRVTPRHLSCYLQTYKIHSLQFMGSGCTTWPSFGSSLMMTWDLPIDSTKPQLHCWNYSMNRLNWSEKWLCPINMIACKTCKVVVLPGVKCIKILFLEIKINKIRSMFSLVYSACHHFDYLPLKMYI